MSLIEDQLFERGEALEQHLEQDAVNNRKIISYVRSRVTDETLQNIRTALNSGSNQTFDLGDQKLGLGYDGLYHVFERGSDGVFTEVVLPDLPEETSETQRAA
jgi:hypothetical protein